MLFLSLRWFAQGNVACVIYADASLQSLRAWWVMRNSLTVCRHASRLHRTWFTTPHPPFFPSHTLPFPFFSHHTLVTVFLILFFLLPSKQIREQMRGEEWYGWWGMPECQQMGGGGAQRERERMWWKGKSIPWKPILEKKWLMKPDVWLLLAWIITFPMTKQKLPPHSFPQT